MNTCNKWPYIKHTLKKKTLNKAKTEDSAYHVAQFLEARQTVVRNDELFQAPKTSKYIATYLRELTIVEIQVDKIFRNRRIVFDFFDYFSCTVSICRPKFIQLTVNFQAYSFEYIRWCYVDAKNAFGWKLFFFNGKPQNVISN